GNEAIKEPQIIAAQRFIESAPHPSSPPTVNYLHTMLTHFPWSIGEDGRTVDPPYNWRSHIDKRFASVILQRYRASIEFSDRQIGVYLQRLRASGRFDNAMIVIVSDHGTSFDLSMPARANGDADEWLVRIPLVVKFPHQRHGRIDDGAISLVDVAPMIIEALGVSAGEIQMAHFGAARTSAGPTPFYSVVLGAMPWNDWLVSYRVDVARGIYERTQ
ncbi:MAG: sulfatase-like hydrolase/transferase, partial [Candidatus Binataceae bacterium]